MSGSKQVDGAAPSRARRLTALLGASLIAAALVAVPPAGATGATYSGTVVDGSGDPVSGAFVALTGPDDSYGTTAGADGTFSVAAASGSYDVSAQAPGFAAATASADLTGGDLTGQSVALTASGTKFDSLPVYGAQVSGLRRGGAPGEFYLSTSVIPQVFRTIDHGGTWSPATVQYDDSDDGLSRSMNLMRGQHMTTSGYPGEVATIISGSVSASFDFGVTWTTLGGSITTTDDGSGVYMYWAHGGFDSVLVVTAPDGGGTNWVADMTDASPSLTEMTTPYATSSDLLAVAAGTDAPYVAVATPSSGDIAVYELTATTSPGTAESSLDAALASADVLSFGGASQAGTSPSVILAVDTSGDGNAVVAVKAASGSAFGAESLTTATAVNDSGAGRQCISAGGGNPVSADVAPDAAGGGSGALLLLGSCAVIANAGEALDLDAFSGTNGSSIFDAGFEPAANEVTLGPDGAHGVVKSAAFDSDPTGGFGPDFPTGEQASPGSGSDSGGVAVNGLTVPVVKEVVLGPTAGDFAVILSGSAGNAALASTDSGETTTTVVEKGGLSASWWSGSGDTTWISFGAGGAGNLLTVRQDWSPSSDPLSGPNVATAHSSIVGGNITSLVGMPGADTLFYGSSVAGGGAVGRAALTGSGDSITATVAASGERDDPVRALAYCPDSGSAASVADTLFVATGTDGAGAGDLTRIDSASTASDFSGATTGLTTSSPVNDVAVDCASGTVWVGAGTSTFGGLYKSADGAETFSSVNPGSAPSLNVTSVALDPSDVDEVIVAANAEGYVYRSTNGGESWLTPNNPGAPGGRSFMSEGIRGLAVPASDSGELGLGLVKSAKVTGKAGDGVDPLATSGSAFVGTGGGLLEGSVRSGSSPVVPDTAGIYSARRSSSTWGAASKVSSTSSSTTRPVVVVDADRRAHMVYAGVSGLYYRSRGAAASSWSPPQKIAGTSAGDTAPDLVARGTKLYLVFVHTSGNDAIFTARRTSSWSSPARVVTGAFSSPSIAVDRDNNRYIVWAKGSGIGYATDASGRWRVTAAVRGSGTGSANPSIVVSTSTRVTVSVAFARAGTGVVLSSRAPNGDWASAKLPVTRSADTTPSLGIDARGKLHLAFRRTGGSTAGVHYSTNRSGGWTDKRVSTSSDDREPDLAVSTAGSPYPPAVHIAYVRRTGTTGVYALSTSNGTRWSKTRCTNVADARDPAVAVEPGGARSYVVYTRT